MHTLIFDIGKTNKKAFIFDGDYRIVFEKSEVLPQTTDDDGDPCEDIFLLKNWVLETAAELYGDSRFHIDAVNCSAYGASFVHLGDDLQRVAPLYNYLKPFPQDLLDWFLKKYGPAEKLSLETASPLLGHLNSGLQLLWLKYRKPLIFNKIKYSLHLPQWVAAILVSGGDLKSPQDLASEITSIGCHTMLWDFQKNTYHDWVYTEAIDRILPPIVSTGTSVNMQFGGKTLRIGVGIHDSSAALLPYLRAEKKPFLLISTGTWSISLNPFSEEVLTEEDLKNGCLNYLRIDGKPVKASRLFLGNEYERHVEKLSAHFGVAPGYHRQVVFDENIYREQAAQPSPKFHFESLHLSRQQPETNQLADFQNFETAYHRLMMELMDVQAEAVQRAIGQSPIVKIYVDGGFADNDIFVKLASLRFKDSKLRTTQSPLGSALGAAMVISDKKVKPKFLKKHYAMRKHHPLILAE